MILLSSCACLCPIHWGQVLSREWRCSWSSADRRCSNYIWVINSFIGFSEVPYIRCFTVITVWYQRQYILRIMHKFMLCYVLLWLGKDQFKPYPSGLLHWHWGIVKQPQRIWVNKSHGATRNSWYKHNKHRPYAYFMETLCTSLYSSVLLSWKKKSF